MTAGTWVIGNIAGPRMVVEWMRRNPETFKNTDIGTSVDGAQFVSFEMAILVIGSILSGILFIQGFFMLCANLNHPQHLPAFLDPIVSAASWNGEVKVYIAAKRKLGKLVRNALLLHDSNAYALLLSSGSLSKSSRLALAASQESNTLRNYILRSDQTGTYL